MNLNDNDDGDDDDLYTIPEVKCMGWNCLGFGVMYDHICQWISIIGFPLENGQSCT